MTSRIGKRDSWEVPVDHFEPALPRRRPNYGTGNTVGKRMTGAVTGVAKPKRVGPTRVAARRATGMLPIGQPPIPPNMVGKRGFFGRPPYGDLEPWEGAIIGGAAGGATAGTAAQIHYRRKRRQARNAQMGKRFFSAGQRRKMASRGQANPDGSYPIKSQHDVVNAERLLHFSSPTKQAEVRSRIRSFEASKRDRSYNPEHNRQRRLGLATAATGIGGLAAGGSAAHDIRRDTGTLRGIDPDVVHVPREPSKPRSQKRGAGGRMESLTPAEHAAEQKDYNERLGHRVRRQQTREGLERARAAGEKGLVVTRRSAGKLGVGAGLLTASAGLAHYGRSRSNREWH